jgi:hypothetical protein
VEKIIFRNKEFIIMVLKKKHNFFIFKSIALFKSASAVSIYNLKYLKTKGCYFVQLLSWTDLIKIDFN